MPNVTHPRNAAPFRAIPRQPCIKTLSLLMTLAPDSRNLRVLKDPYRLSTRYNAGPAEHDPRRTRDKALLSEMTVLTNGSPARKRFEKTLPTNEADTVR